MKNGKLAEAHLGRGLARVTKDNYAGAMADLDQALHLNPDFGVAPPRASAITPELPCRPRGLAPELAIKSCTALIDGGMPEGRRAPSLTKTALRP